MSTGAVHAGLALICTVLAPHNCYSYNYFYFNHYFFIRSTSSTTTQLRIYMQSLVDCFKPEKLIDRCYIIISLLGIRTFSQLIALVYRQDIIYMRLWIHCHLFNVLLYFDVHQYNIILNIVISLLNPVNPVVTKKVKWL